MSHAHAVPAHAPSQEPEAHGRPQERAQPAAGAPGLAAPSQRQVRALQRAAGNGAVQRLLSRGGGSGGRAPAIQRHEGPTILSPEGEEDSAKAKAAEKTPAEKKMEEVKAILDKSPVGKAALAILDKYKVPIDLNYGGPGSIYQPPAPGSIKILKTKSAAEAAFTLVHEANHAEASNLGKTADISKLERAAYVKSMLDEEATSTVNAILSKVGMSGDDKKGVAANPLLMARYEKARKAAIDAKKTPEEADKAAWQSIRDAFTDGTLVTSNTKEAYDVYYGKAWDKVHAPPKKDAL